MLAFNVIEGLGTSSAACASGRNPVDPKGLKGKRRSEAKMARNRTVRASMAHTVGRYGLIGLAAIVAFRPRTSKQTRAN